ncbi:hypothetical protein PV05_02674 [Exophiala xenobiotica]|uniref:Uncharacterized protein n=1 Tax=Exophiala xenobiotica TaxID=348802 RepID=A0A0D2C069_9EURO|nr:uncharacterized protein PV05_02674 [Exophiala xenobiotica]KIW58126.1 hypothetical protein PV05_02674 [Exophiala xenobiotica]
MGDWEKAPSGINQTKKLRLLAEEGVHFDTEGKLITSSTTTTTPTTTSSSTVKKRPKRQAAGVGHVWFDGASSLDSDLDNAREELKIIMEKGTGKV